MIKSFLSKILGKQEKSNQKIKLNLNDLERNINELKDKENEKVIFEGKIVSNNIKSDIYQIKSSLKKLTEKEISNQDEKLYNIAKGSKKSLLTNISSGLDKIIIPEKINYDSLKELNNCLTTFFNSISKSAKNFYYTSLVSRDHIKEITNVLKRLENENKKLKEIIDSENIMNLNNIIIKIKSIKNNQDEIQKMEKQEEVLKKIIKHQEQSNIQLKEQIEKLRNSKQYKSFLENKEKIKTLETKIEHNKMNIRSQIVPLIKILKKYEHMETDKNKIKNISSIIQDPVNFSLNNYLTLKDILIELKEAIINNKFNLNQREKEKKLSKLKEIENDSLYHLLENHKKLNSNLEQIKKDDFPVLNKVNQLENQKSSINNEPIKSDIIKIRNFIEKRKQSIVSEKQNIQEILHKIDEISIYF